jgi:predicted transcriptional regulator
MEEIVNPFRSYLAQTGETVHAFAKRAFIPVTSLYEVFRGRKPRKRLASKICRNSKGNLTLKDFGY